MSSWQPRVKDAILRLKERAGSSLHAIKQALGVKDDRSQWKYVNAALRAGLADGTFVKNGGRWKVSGVAAHQPPSDGGGGGGGGGGSDGVAVVGHTSLAQRLAAGAANAVDLTGGNDLDCSLALRVPCFNLKERTYT